MSELKRPDLDRHYRDVIDSLTRGRLIFFLGAGVNLCDRGPSASWSPGDLLPSGRQLANFLALETEFPVKSHPTSGRCAEDGAAALDLLSVAQHFLLEGDERKLYDVLHDVFDKDYSPSSVHTFLAKVPSLLTARSARKPHLVIVTTNYDDLMERAIKLALPDVANPYDLVYYDARLPSKTKGKFLHRTLEKEDEPTVILDPNSFTLPLDQRSVILKIHGAVARGNDSSHDSYVIAEDHYFDYPLYNEIPVTIREEFRKRRFLFLGYSLADWNLRMMFRRIWRDQELEMKSWTVNFSDDEMQRRFWEKRNVRYVAADLKEYIHDLELQLSRP